MTKQEYVKEAISLDVESLKEWSMIFARTKNVQMKNFAKEQIAHTQRSIKFHNEMLFKYESINSL